MMNTLALALQYVSIVIFHDFVPALTPGLMEDDASLEFAYTLMQLIHG